MHDVLQARFGPSPRCGEATTGDSTPAAYDAGELVLKQIEGRVEDLARVGVTLALHLLHPLVPDRLAGNLGPAGQLVGRNLVAIELVISRLGALDHALLGGIEEIAA